MTAFLKTDESSKNAMIWQWLTRRSPSLFPKWKTKNKKATVVSDVMWFLVRYAHPGTAGTRRYEYSTAPSITLGTLRKLYAGLRAKQTDRCWSHHWSPWLHRDSAADEPTRTCGRWDRRRKRLLHQKSSGKIHAGGSWCAFRRGKVLCFVFVCFLFPPLGLSCQLRPGSGVSCRVAFS